MEAECFAEPSPFRQEPKEQAFATFTLTSHRQAAKVLLSGDREKEKEKERYLHRQSLEMLGHFCGTGMVKIVEN